MATNSLKKILDVITMSSSLGMLLLTIGALFWILKSKERVKTSSNIVIFLLLIGSFTCDSILQAYGLKSQSSEHRTLRTSLFAAQFVFQWLSLLIFTLNYQSAEIEIRKVLNQKNIQSWNVLTTGAISVMFIILACAASFGLTVAFGKNFYDSWTASLGEALTSFVIFMIYTCFVKKIHTLLTEIDLDLVQVNANFCQTIGVVGLLFLACSSQFALRLLQNTLNSDDSEIFILMAIAVQILQLVAYLSFFFLVYRETRKGRKFIDLILHKEVPELVYLQTRKLLRDTHLNRVNTKRAMFLNNQGSSRTASDSFYNHKHSKQANTYVYRNKSVASEDKFEPLLDKLNDIEEAEHESVELAYRASPGEKEKEVAQLSSINSSQRRMSVEESEPKMLLPTIAEERNSSSQKGDEHAEASLIKSNHLSEQPKSLRHQSSMTRRGAQSQPHQSSSGRTSFHTAQMHSESNQEDSSNYQTCLHSSTPYAQLKDVQSSENKESLLRATSLTEIKEHTELGTTFDATRKQTTVVPELLIVREGIGEVIQKQEEDERSESDHSIDSAASEAIRAQAEEILSTYKQRLRKVGKAQFQVRLNIFFSFVKETSLDAEAYDYLQSVEGSVMNKSDDSDIFEKVYERTQTLTQINMQGDIEYN